jgi:phosphoribosylamine--glycine ligase
MQVVEWCRETEIDLVTIGPEVPLVAGLADDLRQAGIKYPPPSHQSCPTAGHPWIL